MRIEALSIRSVTVIIILMIGVVSIVLSLLAGSYFRQAALHAQMSSLSRVIEVASQEMLKAVRGHAFDLGMRLGHSPELVQAIRSAGQPGGDDRLRALLDDPFINGFVGFANINLEKIRVYDLDLQLVAESGHGLTGMSQSPPAGLVGGLAGSPGVERLKAIDALWISPQGPLHSTLVPVGGLRLIGYLEIVINPVFNLPDIGKITRTPISIFSMDGRTIIDGEAIDVARHLPIEYVMPASDGRPAFRIVGYENVERLNAEMDRTRTVTISGFLLLTFGTLLIALWLFNRFLFVPVRRMVQGMRQMAMGTLDLDIDKRGLREFSQLATSFEAMAGQVRMRTNDLERLLDLDDSAILCFGSDGEAVYFNRGAAQLFGYGRDEVADLDLSDLFADDIAALMTEPGQTGEPAGHKRHVMLNAIRKEGSCFVCDAMIRALAVQGGRGYAIVLNSTPDPAALLTSQTVVDSFQKNEQRMNAVEQSLNSLLELARQNPSLLPGSSPMDQLVGDLQTGRGESGAGKADLREQAVRLMCAALACWEHDLGRSKLDLAEASRIWPVYMDKSTPTTRTLDKYLNIESCPHHPRTQRVIDTAEFVLRELGRKTTVERKKLQQALGDFRQLLSGKKSADR